jgi:general secretion pathway protein G
MGRRSQKGLTLIELIVAFTIMLILTAMAVPMARNKVRSEHERDLRYAQREVRLAIDKFKDNCDMGYLGPQKLGSNCYPETLEQLVEGVKLPGPEGKKMRFLRRIPRDPFTGKADWGLRSDQDDPDSTSWGGQDVFDIYTKSMQKAPDGTSYSQW